MSSQSEDPIGLKDFARQIKLLDLLVRLTFPKKSENHRLGWKKIRLAKLNKDKILTIVCVKNERNKKLLALIINMPDESIEKHLRCLLITLSSGEMRKETDQKMEVDPKLSVFKFSQLLVCHITSDFTHFNQIPALHYLS